MEDNSIVGLFMWIVGVLVALAVGAGMIDGTLSIPFILPVITAVAGWVVVIGAVISVLLALFKK
jgi:hypothetical protein